MPAAIAFPASTVMAFRSASRGPEVFLVRRHIRMGFFGGAYVFPGGRVDDADRDAEAAAWCTGTDDARLRLRDLDPVDAVAFHLAAIRELFEEAGILMARDSTGQWAYRARGAGEAGRAGEADRAGGASGKNTQSNDEPRTLEVSRRAVHTGSISLRAALEPLGLQPALEALLPAGHWVTPEIEPKRFDTRFFVAAVEGSPTALHDDAEHVESAWMTPSEALRRFARREIVLAPPTWRMLRDFATCTTWGEIERQAGAIVIRRVQPRFVQENGEDLLVVPGDALYPAPAPERIAPPTRFRRDGERWEPVESSHMHHRAHGE